MGTLAMARETRRAACAICATEHRADHAHNWWSVSYGMAFLCKTLLTSVHCDHGRDPTHADTVAHLSAEQQAKWRTWSQPVDTAPIAEPYVVSDGRQFMFPQAQAVDLDGETEDAP